MPFQEFYDNIRTNITRHGQTVIHVGGDTDAPAPAFSYTIGNREKGNPEFIVFGLDPRVAQSILNDLRQITTEKGPFKNNELVYLGGPHPLKVAFTTTDAPEKYGFQISRYYDIPPAEITMMQAILCDPDGKFPGDPTCQEPYASLPNLAQIRH